MADLLDLIIGSMSDQESREDLKSGLINESATVYAGAEPSDPTYISPMTKVPELLDYYLHGCIDLIPGAESGLLHDLYVEDEVFGQAVADIMVPEFAANAPALSQLGSFTHPLAFIGGRANLLCQLEVATDLVSRAAAKTGAEAPPIYCVLWPDYSLNARSILRPAGGLVMVNTGLIAAMRLLIQRAVLHMATISGAYGFGPDVSTESHSRKKIAKMMRNCADKKDVRPGARLDFYVNENIEFLRRVMSLSALCHIIAHEVGHLSKRRPGPPGRWLEDNHELQRDGRMLSRKFPPTDQVGSTWVAESVADTIAGHICRRDPISRNGDPSVGLMLGSMATLALQAALWWQVAAQRKGKLEPTHPYPEFRISMIRYDLGIPREEWAALTQSARFDVLDPNRPRNRLEVVADNFQDWAARMMSLDKNKARAQRRGLTGRGVNFADQVNMKIIADIENQIAKGKWPPDGS